MKLKNLNPQSFNPSQWINLFNIYQDNNGNYFFNLFNSLQLKDDDINPVYYDEYYATDSDNLFHLSHKFYGNLQLWWIIAEVNKVNDPFFIEDQKLKILKPEIVSQIIEFVLDVK